MLKHTGLIAQAAKRLALPLTGLRCGFDARTLPNADVSMWSDVRGGGSIYASQATGALQPGYEASVASLNGQPAAVFAAGDLLEITGINVAAAAGFSFYWVGDIITLNAFNASSVFLGNQTSLYAGFGFTAQHLSAYLDQGVMLGYAADSRPGPVCHAWTTGLTPRAYIDRILAREGAVGAQKGINASPPTIGGASPNGFAFKLGAFFIYDGVHDATQRAAVWDYIYQEWRVAPLQGQGAGLPVAYDLVVLAGQSNARGNALLSSLASPYEQPYPGVRFYDSTPLSHRSREWGDLGPVTSFEGYGFGCEVSLGRDLAADPGWPNPAIYKCAKGSTNLAVDWAPNTGESWLELRDVYARAQAALPVAGSTLVPRAFVWIQGESDSAVLAYANAYEANLTAFIASIRTLFGVPDLGFWIVRLTTPNSFGPYEDTVIAAQNAVAAADPNVYIVPPPSPLPDGVHYSAAGLVSIGQVLAASIIAS